MLGKKTSLFSNGLLWIIGFVLYIKLISLDTIIGSTLPVMLIIGLLCLIVHGGKICSQVY